MQQPAVGVLVAAGGTGATRKHRIRVQDGGRMKIILTQRVQTLGEEGQVVEVAPGYARNYLLPRQLAVSASKNNLKVWEEKRQAIELRRAQEKDQAQALAEKLAGLSVTVSAKAGPEGRLYGAVTVKDVAEAIQKEAKVEIDKKDVELAETVKQVGDFHVKIKLHSDVEAEVTLKVEADESGVDEES